MSDDNSLRTRQIYWTRSLLAIPCQQAPEEDPAHRVTRAGQTAARAAAPATAPSAT
jgi:hypothetical protein